MGSLVGVGINDVVEIAGALGSTVDASEYTRAANEMAATVYSQSPITENADLLVSKLTSLGFRIGLVTQSPHQWIDLVVPRLSFKEKLEVVISLHDHPELRRKPNPDGYLYTCTQLAALPQDSVVLEDSNRGIESGKAAGCYTIGYRGNLVESYQQTGADAYAEEMRDVITLVEKFSTPR
jgi:beta-phosphoglucomutase-like phosphatase (HAD superfamily)